MAIVVERKINEKILIIAPSGEEITISVRKQTLKKSKLIVDAPKSYKVLRSELIEGDESHPLTFNKERGRWERRIDGVPFAQFLEKLDGKK